MNDPRSRPSKDDLEFASVLSAISEVANRIAKRLKGEKNGNQN